MRKWPKWVSRFPGLDGHGQIMTCGQTGELVQLRRHVQTGYTAVAFAHGHPDSLMLLCPDGQMRYWRDMEQEMLSWWC